MKRTPMVRTAFHRKEPSISRSEHPRAKDKECANPSCKTRFTPVRPMQKVCGPICARRVVDAKKKAERENLKARKENSKTRRDRIADAQAAVNKYSRLRDIRAGLSCVSCRSRPGARFGGAMDAGHYRSVGSAPHLRFLTSQIRLQCVKCNRYLSGNVVEFRKALVAERGAAWVEWLESLQGAAKWDEDYLIRLKRIANKKTRRLEKRNAMQG